MKRLLILLFILTRALTVLSADIDFYGKVNLGIWYFSPERFYDDTSEVIIDTVTGDTISVTLGLKDTMGIIISNWLPFGTFGVKFKGDRFGGCVELGTYQNMYDSRMWGDENPPHIQKKALDYITMKKWYAEWYINDLFTLLFGKSLSLTNFFPSNQIFWAGYGFNNIGCLCTGSHPMFKLTVKSPNEVFEGKIAVIKSDTSVINIRNKYSQWDNHQCASKIPKFEGGLKYSIEKGIFSTYGNFAGGFQKYEVVLFSANNSIPEKDSCYLNISSYVIGADLGIGVGPVSLSVDMLYGKNIGIYGVFVGDEFGWWRTDDYMAVFYPGHGSDSASAGEWIVQNGTAREIAGILKIKPWEFLSFEGGVGMVSGDHDFERFKQDFHNTFAWYFQTELTVLEMLKFTPEVGQYDYGPLDGFGRYIYWGMNTGIEF